ncbi:DUF1223 domain-containing protein [Methylocella silvestris]|uniref:DUF1223 domain-containing protein n=1 Tax=Methylocella silvestris TaxID=199596 RepID=A0A2J7TGQ9_METSI|nr:DUF1223 domain-containing protein [Methylocella silvestris]
MELFTSQGCSFCPPADALLAALARKPDVVAVSFPVDYWDYIGWKDTMASPVFVARQRAYAAKLGEQHAYTPQIIVDGLQGAVGSDRKEIDAALASARSRDGAMTVPVRLTQANGALAVEVGEGAGGPAVVIALRVLRSRTVHIGRGENAGRNVTYTNVVRGMDEIGVWDGAAATFHAPDARDDGEGYVIFVQKGSLQRPGAILGAAKTAGL